MLLIQKLQRSHFQKPNIKWSQINHYFLEFTLTVNFFSYLIVSTFDIWYDEQLNHIHKTVSITEKRKMGWTFFACFGCTKKRKRPISKRASKTRRVNIYFISYYLILYPSFSFLLSVLSLIMLEYMFTCLYVYFGREFEGMNHWSQTFILKSWMFHNPSAVLQGCLFLSSFIHLVTDLFGLTENIFNANYPFAKISLWGNTYRGKTWGRGGSVVEYHPEFQGIAQGSKSHSCWTYNSELFNLVPSLWVGLPCRLVA